MILKKLLIKSIDLYQLFISPMLGNNCRYYPSCSEYSKIQFELNNPLKAFIVSIKRILTCNQLFKGGIDYPVIELNLKNIKYKKLPVKYWLIPLKKNKYYVIKAEV
ncbi:MULTISPECIES: membrane protein insertion efficiency factor YidD [unclassified Lebetimonas]|uniref:membrane protein insertion efficiency factor YidD n=2 Tax=Lebetimonas TaxID=267989 RepID=UPI0005558F00|nr:MULTISPECIES: membrane protein insertion efficiency factor YidD [unclassified Lebetimonas]